MFAFINDYLIDIFKIRYQQIKKSRAHLFVLHIALHTNQNISF